MTLVELLSKHISDQHKSRVNEIALVLDPSVDYKVSKFAGLVELKVALNNAQRSPEGNAKLFDDVLVLNGQMGTSQNFSLKGNLLVVLVIRKDFIPNTGEIVTDSTILIYEQGSNVLNHFFLGGAR